MTGPDSHGPANSLDPGESGAGAATGLSRCGSTPSSVGFLGLLLSTPVVEESGPVLRPGSGLRRAAAGGVHGEDGIRVKTGLRQRGGEDRRTQPTPARGTEHPCATCSGATRSFAPDSWPLPGFLCRRTDGCLWPPQSLPGGARPTLPGNRTRRFVPPRTLVELTNAAYRDACRWRFPVWNHGHPPARPASSALGNRSGFAWCRAFASNKPFLEKRKFPGCPTGRPGEAWVGSRIPMTSMRDNGKGPVAALPPIAETLLIPNTVALVAKPGRASPEAVQLFAFLQSPTVTSALQQAGALETCRLRRPGCIRIGIGWFPNSTQPAGNSPRSSGDEWRPCFSTRWRWPPGRPRLSLGAGLVAAIALAGATGRFRAL